ncbi:MAG TPA: hypothetical protein VIF63_07940 [Candidatus Limnocylindrales bacterium]
MADLGHDRDEATEAALAVAARHALHDEELIAGFAVDGLDDDADIAKAKSLVERCAACRDLFVDVQAISGALRVEARRTIAAPRDFQLSVDDARRLGGTISPRGFVRNLRRAMVSFGRPIGASMAALGIVGVLVGSFSFGGLGAAGAPTAGNPGPGAAATDAAIKEQTGPESAAPGATTDSTGFGPYATELMSAADEAQRDLARLSAPGGAGVLFAGSIGLLIVGLSLAWYATRRTDRKRLDPSRFH